MHARTMATAIVVATLLSCLAACGGGGSGGTSVPPTPEFDAADFGAGFPFGDGSWSVAYHPSWDRPDTEAVETDPATIEWYDGDGDYTYYDEGGNEIEYPAEWYRVGAAQLDGTTWSWDRPVQVYAVFEPSYYE